MTLAVSEPPRYSLIMEVVEALAIQRQMNTINSILVSGNDTEVEAALRAKDFILGGSDTARVIN